jgi:hypothetical protein
MIKRRVLQRRILFQKNKQTRTILATANECQLARSPWDLIETVFTILYDLLEGHF